MDIFRRIFFVVVLSGAMAGLFSAAIQQWRVVPLILEAELYEGDAHDHLNGGTNTISEEEQEPWAPQDGFERTMFTVLATVLTSMGFAFLMAAVSIFTKIDVTVQNASLWGLGGFLAFSMMPAIGLAPELPGMIAADLGARQGWWWFTALATLGAILVVVKSQNYAGIAVALVLIALPHIMGAPMAPHGASDVPAHLATSFAANALFASLAFWLVLGVLYGWLNQLQGCRGDA